MRMYRVVTFLAALIVAGLFIWALGHEQVGAKEEQAIKAATQ
jgi:hypothetical protein